MESDAEWIGDGGECGDGRGHDVCGDDAPAISKAQILVEKELDDFIDRLCCGLCQA